MLRNKYPRSSGRRTESFREGVQTFATCHLSRSLSESSVPPGESYRLHPRTTRKTRKRVAQEGLTIFECENGNVRGPLGTITSTEAALRRLTESRK